MIYAIHHRKGGVGKTTLTQHLAHASALAGFHTIMIDADGQSNLTRVWGIEPEALDDKTLSHIITGWIDGAMVPRNDSEYIRYHITPLSSHLDLIGNCPNHSDKTEQKISHYDGRREIFLAKLVKELKTSYHNIFIDTGPGRDWFCRNALLAADRILVPVQMERLSTEGLIDLSGFIHDLGTRYTTDENPLSVYRLIPTLFNGSRRRHRSLLVAIRDFYPELCSKTTIRQDADIEHAQNENKSIFEYAPKGRAANDYTQLALEVLT
jgi:chromosome partitioning protein